VLRGDVPDDARLALEDHGKYPVIRRDEILFFAAHQQRTALRSDSRVHNHDMNGARGKIPVGFATESAPSRTSNGVTWWLRSTMRAAGLMFRITPFMVATRWSAGTEIGGQSDDGIGHENLR